MRRLGGLLIVAVLAAIACDDESSSSGSGSSPDAPISVAGTERIGWDQMAPEGSQAFIYQYSAYVDDVPSPLPDAVCQSSGTTSFSCLATLPSMSPGPHRLEITASLYGLEGPRSQPIYLEVVTRARAAARAASAPPSAITTSDGVPLAVEVLATGLDLPSSLAVTPDGRIFITQGSGNLHVWQENQILTTPAVQLPDMQRAPGVGLAGMTLDIDFATNGRAFVAYVGLARNGSPVNRIVRFREANNVFAEAAVIFEDPVDVVPARPPRIRMGRDRKLYVVFPAADWPTADGFASYAGKILRVNDDGTTPSDNPGSSPIISAGHAAAGGFDWQPSTRLWLSERDRYGRDVLDYFSGAFDSTAPAAFDSRLDASGAAFYPMTVGKAFAGDLFIAGLSGQLRRLRFDSQNATRVEATENLMEREYGRLSDVVVGPDGALYVTTSNRGLPGAAPGDDRLLRLSVVAR